MASEKQVEANGTIINSWKGMPFPAWEPPFMMLNAGNGMLSLVAPDISAI